MDTFEEQLWILLDVIIAAVLAVFIGGEREKLDKPAGLRTNMIVSSISCFFVATSPSLNNFIQQQITTDLITIDPIRILQAIIVGISFIGAGTILKSREEDTVKNLTTASTVLYSSGIGISVAIKDYAVAVGLTLLILIINSLHHFQQVKSWFVKKDDKK